MTVASMSGLLIGRHYGVDPFTTTLVSEIMTNHVEVIDASATLGEAREHFASRAHSAYPIIDPDGTLRGIVTRGDLISTDEESETSLLDAASTDVVTVDKFATASAVLHIMLDERVEHVPVVEHGKLIGICTRSDLLEVRRAHAALDKHVP